MSGSNKGTRAILALRKENKYIGVASLRGQFQFFISLCSGLTIEKGSSHWKGIGKMIPGIQS
jgi:hypothetical protein